MARRRLVIAALLAPPALVAAALLFAWSGLYDVAASERHWRVTAWFLHFGMRHSVATHARSIEAPPQLDQASLVERGAGHFARGCAPCHGAPGVPPSPITLGMLPSPPDLAGAVPRWQPHELFWIVLHGLKYAGMPAWPAPERRDEVWAVTAFLLRLPGMTPAAYRDFVMPDGDARAPGPPAGLAALDEVTLAACARCHGAGGQGGSAGGVPRIAGQKRAYLQQTLEDYRSGIRQSGIMGPVAALLDDATIRDLATHYATLGTPPDPPPAADAALLQTGGSLAAIGNPTASIAACSGCHGADGSGNDRHAAYPSLAGQHAPYLEQQLRLWREGIRGGSHAELMAAAVRGLSDEQIRTVSLYYAGLR